MHPSEFNPPESEAGSGGDLVTHPPAKPKIDLRDAEAIRRELGAVYRDMRSGRIQTADGTKLAFVLDLLRRAYETAELQARIEALEGRGYGKH